MEMVVTSAGSLILHLTSGIFTVTTTALALASGLLHYRNSGSKLGHQLAMF